MTANRLVNSIDEDQRVNLVHIDNWVEINNINSTSLLEKWIDIIIQGGYLLARNYGRSDREGWNESVDKATQGLNKIETMGLITVFQK